MTQYCHVWAVGFARKGRNHSKKQALRYIVSYVPIYPTLGPAEGKHHIVKSIATGDLILSMIGVLRVISGRGASSRTYVTFAAKVIIQLYVWTAVMQACVSFLKCGVGDLKQAKDNFPEKMPK